MTSISYNTGCRNCLKSNGIRTSYMHKDEGDDSLSKKTEFGVMKLIEEWQVQGNHHCDFCGSTNVEVLEIEVNGCRLYDYNKIIQRCRQRDEDMFQLNIDKESFEIRSKAGGSEFISQDLLKAAIKVIAKIVSDRPHEHFKAHTNGNFFVCLTGTISFPQLKPYLRVETFRSAGLTKNEITEVLKPMAEKIGVSL